MKSSARLTGSIGLLVLAFLFLGYAAFQSVSSPTALIQPQTETAQVAGSSSKVIILTSGTAWTVPSDWNNSANTIEAYGAGGGGGSTYWNSGGGGGSTAFGTYVVATGGSGGGSSAGCVGGQGGQTTGGGTGDNGHCHGAGGSGGGGGAYAKATNVTLTPNSTVAIAIGQGGGSGSYPVAGVGGAGYFSGGTGTDYGGGGGAGSTSNGGNASGNTGGAAGTGGSIGGTIQAGGNGMVGTGVTTINGGNAGGPAGGAGGTTQTAGSIPGGGGGGVTKTQDWDGTAGAQGEIIITYTPVSAGSGSTGSGSGSGTTSASPTTYNLSVTNSNTAGGTVTSNPTGISCGATCSVSSITSGTSYTLTAIPNTNYTASWSGCSSTNGNGCSVGVSANTSVSVSFIQSTPPPSSPTISAVSASNVTSTGATITWTTSTAASSDVIYGLTTLYGDDAGTASALTTSHSMTLSGLTANTTYDYAVVSTDGSGNTITSSNATFTTGAAVTTGSQTYYIDYVNGSDSNSGLSTSAPWKHQPFMVGTNDHFTGTYTHHAADRFIFKGGVTWPNASFPLSIPDGKGGSGTNTPDYYGVDKSWYTGASFSQPIFDAQGTCMGITATSGTVCGGTFINANENKYITIDNIHFTNYYWQGAVRLHFGSAVMINAGGTSGGFIFENSVIDNWSHDSYAHCGAVSDTCDGGIGIDMGGGSYFTINNNIFQQCNTSSTCGDSPQGGMVYGGSYGTIENNTCSHIESCWLPYGNMTINNNLMYDVSLVNPYDPGSHADVMQIYGIGNENVYDNTIHDVNGYGFTPNSAALVMDWASCEGTVSNIYNNLVYNIGAQTPVVVDSSACTNGSNGTGVSNLWNNTIVSPSGAINQNCIRVINRHGSDVYGTVDLTNTQCITSDTLYTIDAGATVNNLVASRTLQMTPTQAANNGYTSSYSYRPISAASPTVATGANLTSQDLFTADLLGVARPSSGPWDIGAYQYTGSGSTGSGSGGGTVTPPPSIPLILPVIPAPTISSVAASAITSSGATIAWTTSTAASGEAEYGLTSTYGSNTSITSALSTSHSISLTNLASNTTYDYEAISTDGSGNTVTSSNGTFTTLAIPDTTPPTVTITSPASNTSVSGSSVSLAATASDPTVSGQTTSGIATVQFMLDGESIIGGELTTAPYAGSWNTTGVSNGTHTLTAVATDGAGNTTTSSGVTVTVNNTVPPPVFIQTPSQSIPENALLTFTVSATDAAGYTLTYSASNLPAGAAFTSSTHAFSWTPSYAQSGSYTPSFSVSDGHGGTATENVAITVTNVNRPPTSNAGNNQSITLPADTATLSGSASSDPDGDTLTYRWSQVSGPSATLSSASAISPTATLTTAGTYVFSLSVTDPGGLQSTSQVTVTLLAQTVADSDGDGIPDASDVCPNTPVSLKNTVNAVGCPLPLDSSFSTLTDLSHVNLNSVSSFNVGNSSGSISFATANGPYDLLGAGGTELDLNDNISITPGSITLNSTALPQLDTPATITFTDISIPTPEILRNDSLCSGCAIVSYTNDTLVFSVPGFSTYTIVAAPSPTPTPTPTPSTPPAGGGGSAPTTPPASSGGGSTAPITTSGGGSPAPAISSPGGGGSSSGGGGVGIFTPTVPQKPATTCPIPSSALSFTIGTRTTAVTSLQTFLIIQGYLPRQDATGYYGSITQGSLAAYAKAHPACTTSTVTAAPIPTTPAVSTVTFTRTLSLGSSGADVKALQQFLNSHGFLVAATGNGSPAHETTVFGSATKAALIRFQAAHGIPATGFFGPITMKEANLLEAQGS